MSQYQLKFTSEIINLSSSKTWDTAKLEWELKEIYKGSFPETCLCGHFPIVEICVLRNKTNGKEAIVGNCCVKKFIGPRSDKIFQAVKRIQKDNKKSLNAETIQYAYHKAWINKWEKEFYLDIMRKRNLSDKQVTVAAR